MLRSWTRAIRLRAACRGQHEGQRVGCTSEDACLEWWWWSAPCLKHVAPLHSTFSCGVSSSHAARASFRRARCGGGQLVLHGMVLVLVLDEVPRLALSAVSAGQTALQAAGVLW
jgi:hypothetical protein